MTKIRCLIHASFLTCLLAPIALEAQTRVVLPEQVDYFFSHGRKVQLKEIKDDLFYRINAFAKLANDGDIRSSLEDVLGAVRGGGSGDELAFRLHRFASVAADAVVTRVVKAQELQRLRAFTSARSDVVYVEYPEVILQCSATTTLAEVEAYLRKHYQVQVKPTGLGAGQFLIRVMTPSQTMWLANQLQSTRALPIEYAEVNFHLAHPASAKAGAKPSFPKSLVAESGGDAGDPGYTQQWALDNPGDRQDSVKGADVGFSRARQHGPLSAAGMKVALLDYAIDIDHPDLAGAIDRDHVFNATRFAAGMDLADPALKELDYREEPAAYADHGTACAGIIGALTGNHIGMSGIAPGVQIVPIQIAVPVEDSQYDLVVNGLQMRAALQAAERAGAQIVSLSWSLRTTSDDDIQVVQTQIKSMNQARNGLGIIVVSAAGNDSVGFLEPDFPAANYGKAPNLLAAGASNWCGEIKTASSCDMEPWTSRRNDNTLFAPGVGIFTTTNHRDKQDPNGNSNYRTDFNGTSAATPFIAGAAALVLKEHSGWSAGMVIDHLMKNGAKLKEGRPGVNICVALYGKDGCK